VVRVAQPGAAVMCEIPWRRKDVNPQDKEILVYSLNGNMQSISRLHSFYPMEVIATREETDRLLAKSKGSGPVLFPELREYPIHMWNDLQYRWIDREPLDKLADSVRQGE
jgi:hypothetical protein